MKEILDRLAERIAALPLILAPAEPDRSAARAWREMSNNTEVSDGEEHIEHLGLGVDAVDR